jgi:hypothetical protein
MRFRRASRSADCARIPDQAADDLRAERKELQAVVAVNSARPNQSKVRLVRQRGGFQRRWRVAGEVPSGNLPDLRIDESDQVIQRLLVSTAPGSKQFRDVVRPARTHARPQQLT